MSGLPSSQCVPAPRRTATLAIVRGQIRTEPSCREPPESAVSEPPKMSPRRRLRASNKPIHLPCRGKPQRHCSRGSFFRDQLPVQLQVWLGAIPAGIVILDGGDLLVAVVGLHRPADQANVRVVPSQA